MLWALLTLTVLVISVIFIGGIYLLWLAATMPEGLDE